MEYDIEILKDKIISEIVINKNRDEIIFWCSDGDMFIMKHQQDCCENVYIEDIDGDLDWLVNTPILKAEEVTNSEDKFGKELYESFTWTFYKFATIRGYITIRWLGESNGYYSEEVNFYKLENYYKKEILVAELHKHREFLEDGECITISDLIHSEDEENVRIGTIMLSKLKAKLR